MAYQFKREPLTPEEADKLYQACNNIGLVCGRVQELGFWESVINFV